MALITKEHLSLVLENFKKLLSFKADKVEVDTELENLKEVLPFKADKTEVNNKIDKDKIATDDDILELLLELEYIIPISDNNNSVFTNKKGEIYIL